MTTPDPFSSERVPNSNSANEPSPTDPSASPAPPAPHHSGYASPPSPQQYGYANPQAYPQQPGYGTPQYGGYQQQGPSAPLDGVSIAAFATGLATLGPVAVILGAIGLGRTAKQARSGRWMAWTGLILGVLGTIGWIAIISFFGWMKDTIEANDGFTVPTDANGEQVTESEVDTYGDDPYLDGLWDSCDAGDMEACDQLFVDAPIFSGYEDFAYECGNEGRKLTQWTCAD